MKHNRHNVTMGILLILSFFILLMEIIFAGPPPGMEPPPPPPEAIDSISLSSASQGAKFVLTVILKEGFEPPPELQVTSVTIGSISGENIKRDGLKIKADFTIPLSEKAGFKDVSVTFPGPCDSTIKLLRPSIFQVKKK